ncbi:MAG: glutamate formimidoyltransferase [Candidatus Margulisbacteria bacterium]|nr:glutamate formimidoyltransferase [Candidatus Margulisiibacteriota bacterium]
MSKLVECVPNFSEGADLALVDEIVAAIKTAKVLNVHSDPDHNRSVVTILGEPDAVMLAAFSLTERAVQLLDINEHVGEHPFIGVMDVIPFIPVKEISIPATVALAKELAGELWNKLKLPVYFYGAAAVNPNRKELPAVRRGSYPPDVGSGLHPTAGAVAVGVRDYLIAFNVNLTTNDLSIAQSIAKNIREKSEGLPGVRALGIDLKSRGITQVSINITDHKTTSLKQVFDEVKRWAKEYQVGIIESELVGMLPQAAVFQGMKNLLKLRNYSDEYILSN